MSRTINNILILISIDSSKLDSDPTLLDMLPGITSSSILETYSNLSSLLSEPKPNSPSLLYWEGEGECGVEVRSFLI